jgi:hypothetical protein
MLGGTTHCPNRATKRFDTDTTAALEEVTTFVTKADAAEGGGLYAPRSSPSSPKSPSASRMTYPPR